MGNEQSKSLELAAPKVQKTADPVEDLIPNTFKTIYDEWDEIDDEEQRKKVIINYLLKKRELDTDIVIKLDWSQKKELIRGISCLNTIYSNKLEQQLNDIDDELNNGEMKLDEFIDAVNDSMQSNKSYTITYSSEGITEQYPEPNKISEATQIKMYNYFLKAIQKQETNNINYINPSIEESDAESDDQDMFQDLNDIEIAKINKFVTYNFVENSEEIENILINKERITINTLCNIESLNELTLISRKLKLNDEQCIKLSQYTKYYFNLKSQSLSSNTINGNNKRIITMRVTDDKESVILRYLDIVEILPCNQWEHPFMEDMSAYTRSLCDRIQSKLISMGLSSIVSKPYRWLRLKDKELLCSKKAAINTLGHDEYILEESIQIYIDQNDESKYHFPTENFKRYGAEYCENVPSDVVIKFDGNNYDIYSTANDIGLKNKDTIFIQHKQLNDANMMIFYKNIDCMTSTVSSLNINVEEYSCFDLKYLISKKDGAYHDIMQLYYGGGILKDEEKLSDYDFTKQYTIYYAIHMSGS